MFRILFYLCLNEKFQKSVIRGNSRNGTILNTNDNEYVIRIMYLKILHLTLFRTSVFLLSRSFPKFYITRLTYHELTELDQQRLDHSYALDVQTMTNDVLMLYNYFYIDLDQSIIMYESSFISHKNLCFTSYNNNNQTWTCLFELHLMVCTQHDLKCFVIRFVIVVQLVGFKML